MFQTLEVAANRKSISQLVKSDDPLLLDLLSKIFKFNPEERIPIEKILKHPYLDLYHDQALEYVNIKRMSTDGQYNSLLEIRQFMY